MRLLCLLLLFSSCTSSRPLVSDIIPGDSEYKLWVRDTKHKYSHHFMLVKGDTAYYEVHDSKAKGTRFFLHDTLYFSPGCACYKSSTRDFFPGGSKKLHYRPGTGILVTEPMREATEKQVLYWNRLKRNYALEVFYIKHIWPYVYTRPAGVSLESAKAVEEAFEKFQKKTGRLTYRQVEEALLRFREQHRL